METLYQVNSYYLLLIKSLYLIHGWFDTTNVKDTLYLLAVEVGQTDGPN